MESEWRFNVWTYGLSYSETALCARKLGDETVLYCKDLVAPGRCRFRALDISSGWPYGHIYSSVEMSDSVAFPWIWSVEPD